MIRVKICGVTRKSDLNEAVGAGANYIGLNFFPKSPRFVDANRARELALETPAGVVKVGLFVDADDAFMDEILAQAPLDMIQLHGEESPERLRAVKLRYGLPVMKALGIKTKDDLAKIEAYDAADQFLLDAKAPEGAVLPGGNGVPFDWRLLEDLQIETPWMLAGGLRPENVREAVLKTHALQVDVSSGVESEPGVKDKALMESFVREARGYVDKVTISD